MNRQNRIKALLKIASEDPIADTINQAIGLATDFTKRHEGFIPHYWDPIGKVWTAGHGHTSRYDAKTRTWVPITANKSDSLDEQTSSSLVTRRHRQNAASMYVKFPWFRKMNSRQQAALLDLAYNVGMGTLSPSVSRNLHRKLSAPKADYDAILREELPTYNKSNGKVIKGLVNRRNDTISEFLAPAKPVPTTTTSTKR